MSEGGDSAAKSRGSIKFPLAALLCLLVLQITNPLMMASYAQQPSLKTASTLGRQDILIIPVEFQDVVHALSLSTVKSTFDSANSYVGQMSYNRTWLNVTVANQWYELPGNFTEYSYPNNLLDVPPLLDAASHLADGEYNVSSWQHIVVLHAGYNFTSMRPEAWGTLHKVIVSERDSPLTVVHELLHSMGGVINGTSSQPLRIQDLYDEAAVEAGASNWASFLGNWDLMSTSDVGPSAFTYLKLGWAGPENVLTVATCSDMTIALHPLELSSDGKQIIRIPLSNENASLINGTTISAPEYLLVEYRERTGVDENISAPSVIVTRASDSRYYAGSPGPVVLEAVLAFNPDQPNIFNDSTDDVSIVVTGQSSEMATVVAACPSRSAVYANSTSLVYSAVSGFGRASEIAVFWADFGPSLSTIGALVNDSLSALSAGKTDAASSSASRALSMIAAKQQGSSMVYIGSTILADLIPAFLFFFVLLPQPKRPTNLYRVCAFDRRSFIELLLLAVLVIGTSTYLQITGLTQDTYGISTLSLDYLQSGQGNLFVGFLFWMFGLLAIWLRVKRERVDVESRDDKP